MCKLLFVNYMIILQWKCRKCNETKWIWSKTHHYLKYMYSTIFKSTTHCANLFFPVHGKENVCNIKISKWIKNKYFKFNNCNQYKCTTSTWSAQIRVNGKQIKKMFISKIVIIKYIQLLSNLHKWIRKNTHIHLA